MKVDKTAIIGGGHLGAAIAEGLLNSGWAEPSSLWVTRRQADKLSALAARGVQTGSDNCAAVRKATVVLLVVKPYQLEEVLAEILPELAPGALLVSLATGFGLERLQALSGGRFPLFRAMPNTAVAVGQSMTCYASLNASPHQEAVIQDLFGQVGQALLLPEAQLAAATALTSCGIAYALRYIRAAMTGGVELGFKSDQAQQLVAQTVKGAALLLEQEGSHPETEIDKVTTPGGVTIRGLHEMEQQGFSPAVIQGLLAACKKMEQA
ncbi:MAG TPA: pyrroline-5-carboxylate reductase [Bacteroidales bacterium]|nr:pyrroline-5-carboxylate reductase [Bacteroidales bacterium]